MINKDGTVVVGLKGRSGRKSYRDEKLKTKVINKAWQMKDVSLTDAEAIQIVVKDMSVKNEHTGKDGKELPTPILSIISNAL